MNTAWIGSPNYFPGRNGHKVNKIVVHWMAGNLASTDAVFQDRARNTSAHYGIEGKVVHQYVNEGDTAYHAGDLMVNMESVGIENSAQPGREASDETYETLINMCIGLCNKYGLNESNVYPHNKFTATQCPGTIDLNRVREGVRLNLGGDEMTQESAESEVAMLYEDVTGKSATAEQASYWVPRVKKDPNQLVALHKALRKSDSAPNSTNHQYKAYHYNEDMKKLEQSLGNPTDLRPGVYKVGKE